MQLCYGVVACYAAAETVESLMCASALYADEKAFAVILMCLGMRTLAWGITASFAVGITSPSRITAAPPTNSSKAAPTKT
eukprot:358281-Chlamydomonas_euryale.AAC.4